MCNALDTLKSLPHPKTIHTEVFNLTSPPSPKGKLSFVKSIVQDLEGKSISMDNLNKDSDAYKMTIDNKDPNSVVVNSVTMEANALDVNSVNPIDVNSVNKDAISVDNFGNSVDVNSLSKDTISVNL